MSMCVIWRTDATWVLQQHKQAACVQGECQIWSARSGTMRDARLLHEMTSTVQLGTCPSIAVLAGIKTSVHRPCASHNEGVSDAA